MCFLLLQNLSWGETLELLQRGGNLPNYEKTTIQVLEEISKGASCEDILSYIEYSDDEFEDFLCAGSWKEVSNSFSPILIPVYENLPQNIQFQYILAKQLYSHSFLLGWHNTIQVKTSVQLLILHAMQISSSLIRHF